MSSDIAIAIALFLGFVGLAIFSIGVVGRHATGEPRCVKCKVDVRSVAWDDAPRCPQCGADLARGGSVRLAGRRRRRPELLTGTVLLLCAIALWRVDAWLAHQRLLWRDLRPLTMEVHDLARSGNEQWEAMESIQRRLEDDQLSPASRRSILAASNATTMASTLRMRLANDPQLEDLWPEMVAGLATTAGSPVLQSLFAESAPGDDVQWLLNCPDALLLGLLWFPIVDRITLDGRNVEFRFELDRRIHFTIPDDMPFASTTVECECRVIVAPFGSVALLVHELALDDGTLRPPLTIGFPCAMRSFKTSAQLLIRSRAEIDAAEAIR